MRCFWIFAVLITLTACDQKTIIHQDDQDLVQIQKRTNERSLASISIMDRNGLSETISAKERLKNYENTNFLTPQPYQKVLRVFAKDKQGDALSLITSYYATGQIRQFLECSNGRAHGRYIEWHPNGQKKLQATILGGAGDLDEKSQTTWAFHETSLCWNEDGKLIAKMPYSQGMLEGKSLYYYPSGNLSEEIPYSKGEINGKSQFFDEDGSLLSATDYLNGVKSGKAISYWTKDALQSDEEWNNDQLVKGTYYAKDGTLIASVENSSGKRVLFGDEGPSEIQDYVNGRPEGEVVLFNDKGTIVHRLHVKDNEKHGLETYYWPLKPTQTKLTIEWEKGQIHGLVKTWYEDGTPESSREMCRNQKQGTLTGWYKDGKIMLIEEYEKDRLVRGDYIKRGSIKPVTQVIDGKGVATFFDADGTFKARVTYLEGKPVLDDLLSEK